MSDRVLIGCGRWRRVLLENFRRLAPVPVVVDPRADALAPDLQREFPSLSVVSTLDRFLEDPELSVAVVRTLEALSESLRQGGRIVPV